MKHSHLHYQIALTLLEGVGPVKAKEIINSYNSLEDFFTLKPIQLAKQSGYSKSFLSKINRSTALKKSETIVENIGKNKLQTIFIKDDNYPHRLKNCDDSPILLYKKGGVDLNPPKTIAIVGTRNATQYGKDIVDQLIKSFAGENIVIVSGLAYGIDAAVHRACLKYDIPTLGVLGNGLDRVYPAMHRELAQKMLKNGGLLSEFIPGTIPDRENFPKRNRIVAGITDATIVIESKKRGGSLITANLANDYNRDVFAYPGSVHMETSQGCNLLIAQQKAHLIQNPEDFKRLMGWNDQEVKPPAQRQLFHDLSEQQQIIIKHISCTSKIQVDILSVKAQLPISILNQELFTLEMNGLVRCFPGKLYAIA